MRTKNGTIKPADLHNSAQPGSVASSESIADFTIGSGFVGVIATTIDAPAPGHAIVYATWHFDPQAGGTTGQCNLSTTEGIFDELYTQGNDFPMPGALVRTFQVPAGETTFFLNCNDFDTQIEFDNPSISGIYTPALYAPPS